MSTASVVKRAPGSTGLYDVLDLILDKGLVIDAYIRVSLVGIEVLTIDLRVVVASVDTYLRFAEAVDRLNLEDTQRDLPELVDDLGTSVGSAKTKGAIKGAGKGISDTAKDAGSKAKDAGQKARKAVTAGGGDDDDDDGDGDET
jgi:gas vesicle structural protein